MYQKNFSREIVSRETCENRLKKMFHVKQSETADICVSRETEKAEESMIGDR